jgi:hypothetical protein
MDYPCGDHIWWNVGVRYGTGAELQMGNISESAFRGAFFGLSELASLKTAIRPCAYGAIHPFDKIVCEITRTILRYGVCVCSTKLLAVRNIED